MNNKFLFRHEFFLLSLLFFPFSVVVTALKNPYNNLFKSDSNFSCFINWYVCTFMVIYVHYNQFLPYCSLPVNKCCRHNPYNQCSF